MKIEVEKDVVIRRGWITKTRSERAFMLLAVRQFVGWRGRNEMRLTSSDFQAGGLIPIQFTCEGDDISPEFSWRDAPAETESFVLTIRDPDAPKAGGFTHWVVYNIPADVGHIEQNVPKRPIIAGLGLQGKNDGGEIEYTGPCPTSGTADFTPSSARRDSWEDSFFGVRLVQLLRYCGWGFDLVLQ